MLLMQIRKNHARSVLIVQEQCHRQGAQGWHDQQWSQAWAPRWKATVVGSTPVVTGRRAPDRSETNEIVSADWFATQT